MRFLGLEFECRDKKTQFELYYLLHRRPPGAKNAQRAVLDVERRLPGLMQTCRRGIALARENGLTPKKMVMEENRHVRVIEQDDYSEVEVPWRPEDYNWRTKPYYKKNYWEKIAGNTLRLPRHFKYGRESGFPVCCILWFCTVWLLLSDRQMIYYNTLYEPVENPHILCPRCIVLQKRG